MIRPTAEEELAEYLRQLKERTGRSYDALARRLGVSSSALHRYCSGDGLPPRFAVLERLAIECGASRAEVVELHRLWANVAAASRVTADGDAGPVLRSASSASSATVASLAVPGTARAGAADRPQETGPVLAGDPAIHGESPRRRSALNLDRWVLWVLASAGLLVAATVLYLAGSRGEDPGTARTEPSAAVSSSAPQPCVERSGVRHSDEQLGARNWNTDYVCVNRAEAPLYLTPSNSQRIGVMDTTRSWFVCWLPGRVQGDSGRIWYYTRGDRSEPGHERWAGWGFMASEHVSTTRHPWPEMPLCDFNADALAARAAVPLRQGP